METKDLQREIIDAERLAERSRLILQFNEQSVALQQENAALKEENAALKADLEALTAPAKKSEPAHVD